MTDSKTPLKEITMEARRINLDGMVPECPHAESEFIEALDLNLEADHARKMAALDEDIPPQRYPDKRPEPKPRNNPAEPVRTRQQELEADVEALDLEDAAGHARLKITDKKIVGCPPMSDKTAEADARANERASVSSILNAALTAVRNRSIERDRDDGERSMEATVTAFNALFDQHLTTEQGWLFMAVLKIARSAGGNMRLDDYTDGSAYMALAGESAAQDRRQG